MPSRQPQDARALSCPGNCGLLTVEHAWVSASGFDFWEKLESTVCETQLETRELSVGLLSEVNPSVASAQTSFF